MENKKVLVAIPYHESKRYCLDRVMDIANSLTYPHKDILMRWDNGIFGGKNNVKNQREYFRQIVLNNPDYIGLFFLGCDTIPPINVIERLLEWGEDIVGGVYWGRHNADNGSPESAVAWIHSMQLKDKDLLMLDTSRRLVKMDGQGMDCVFISRRVLEKVSWLEWEHNDDDYPFYDLALQRGHINYIDPSIQCKHYFSKDGYSFLGKNFV